MAWGALVTMAFYLSRQLGGRIVAVLFGLLSLGLSFDLLENAAKVLEGESTLGLAEYALLRLPLILLAVLPLGVLVGAALGFLALAARNEMVMVRAAGYNTLRVMVMLVPLAILCGVTQSQLASRVGPAAEQMLVERFPALFETEAIERELWLRDWQAVIRVGRAGCGRHCVERCDHLRDRPKGRAAAPNRCGRGALYWGWVAADVSHGPGPG